MESEGGAPATGSITEHDPEAAPPSDERLAVAAAQRIYRSGLATGSSAFAPAMRIWTPEVAGELRRAFVERPDESRDDFLTKFQRQLEDASPEAVVLASELLYLNMLPLHSRQIKQSMKRGRVETVLSWSSVPVSIPEEMLAAMRGFMNGGQAFLNYRPFQLMFLVLLTEHLARLPADERAARLNDPWLFRDECRRILDRLGDNKARAQMHVLLYLLFPDTFIASANSDHKRRIREAFSDLVPEPTGDDDRDLLTIRNALKAETGRPAEFYSQPLRERWDPADDGDSSTHGWFVRGANVDGENFVEDWVRGGFCSVDWPELDSLKPKASKSQIAAAVDAAFPERTEAGRAADRRQLYLFLTEMQSGDLVVTVDGDDVHVGTVDGDAFFEPDQEPKTAWRRRVQWHTVGRPLARGALSDEIQAKLRYRQTVNNVTTIAAALAEKAGLGQRLGEALADETQPVEVLGATAQFADQLLFPLPWIERTLALLKTQRQMILSGPPGTGKTYLARELAKRIATQDNIRLVQFHPSYTYEDFFEGFRPRAGRDGTVTFELVDGPLKALAKQASENPAAPYVLIVDEINRANLAKVFGELYFLLEYRDDPVITQYRPEEDFQLPRNLFLIGTMNTADRSIALVDAAMRRRFVFRRLSPDVAPVQGLLRRWLGSKGLATEPADLLDELNRLIGDPDRMIGPSYLMRDFIDRADELALVWETQIIPLLEDQLYGTGVDVESEYGLEALRAAVASSAPGEDAYQ